MTPAELSRLHEAALATDAAGDWQRLWQALAGTALVLPLHAAAEDGAPLRPHSTDRDGTETITAFAGMELFAESLATPADYAEIDGAQLAGMLSGQGAALAVTLAADTAPLTVPPEVLDWIARTYLAEVDRAEGAGVSVAAPALPAPEVVEAMGQTVAALGADCPEAWLVALVEPGGTPELALVLGL